MYTLEGVSSVANKTETPVFLSLVCSLFPKAIFLTFIQLSKEPDNIKYAVKL